LFAKILGYLFEKIKQPVVIGEILAGVLLGSFVLGKLSGADFSIAGYSFCLTVPDFTSSSFETFGFIGIIMLLFIAGLETDVKEIKKTEKVGFSTAIFGAILPFTFGFFVGQFFGFSLHASLAAGTIFVATSIGVTARTFMDIHALNTDVGTTVLSAAVLDDIIGIFILAVVLGTGSPAFLALKIMIFFLITLYVGLRVISKVIGGFEKIRTPKILITASLVICFVFAVFASEMGLAAVTGAFVAGLIIGTTIQSKKIVDDVKTISYTFFIPLFFVWVGASIDLSVIKDVGPLALLFIPLAIVGKIIGCGAGSKLGGLTSRKALTVGVGMIPRMEVALIVVTTAIAQGIFTGALAHQILAVTVLLVCVTTFLAPILIKATFKKEEK
jgi:Kef-type K+ transport system membrane component KefB